ncbi:hypothetical protein [Phenylobacterium sp.]|uniref:hypothetical protein n=1 Tax=Phenylobacterium sp. TaxID=1871053 RepID=UPI00289E227D|nr:hypothetical protein [Phenylobacterium sp.]
MSAGGQGDAPPKAGMIVSGPTRLILNSVKVSGIAVSTGRPGELMNVAARYSGTSEIHPFHRIAAGVVSLLEQSAAQDGRALNLMAASMLLAVIKPDETAHLYLDAAPVIVVGAGQARCRGRRTPVQQ